MTMPRRHFIAGLGAAAMAGCASGPDVQRLPAVVFVHGNGDSAALWMTTIWRFESNAWPLERLHALDLPYPVARDEDDRPQPGHSSSDAYLRLLAAEVPQVLRNSGAPRIALFGSSRGANAIRNFVRHGGGLIDVSDVILAGGVNHGVWNDPTFKPMSEFNGASPFMKSLNAPRGTAGEEVEIGVRWLTLRSDNNDKYAQPDGRYIGFPGRPTGVNHDGPALIGALNLVLPGLDHREVAFHRDAFALAYRFLAGVPPKTLEIIPEPQVELDGRVSGYGLNNDPTRGDFVTNLPLAGATVEVFTVNPQTGERIGPAVHRQNIGAEGQWGPLKADPKAFYEFVVDAPGYAITHIYRSPFPRSSRYVHLRAERLSEIDRDAAAVVILTRPRGYFGVPRDRIVLDGQSPPPGIPEGVPSVSTAKLKLTSDVGRPVVGEFNGERIAGRAWPAAGRHLVMLELHY
jgi:pimeloyl-ACP methyl ester carboxylesterase